MRKWFFILLLSLMTLNSNAQLMKLGDLNHDNQVNITDIMTLVDIVLHGYSPFDVSPTTVTMQAGGTTTLTIEGGYYYYEVESANPDIVTASVKDLTVTLTAASGGETYVTVKDVLTFRTIVIPVVVEGTILIVSTNSLSLNANETGTVEIKSGSGYYSVQSSDANVATATLSGSTVTVSAVGAGTATITLTDTKTEETAVIEVTVSVSPTYYTCPDDHHPHMIDLGLPSGTKWACCNVGADKPEGYGGYYGWGETEETDYYDWNTYLHCDGDYESCHDIGNNIAGTQYDVAQSEWGNAWVMPSSEQIEELVEYCYYTWTKQNRVNGGKLIGPSGGSIFLPATGSRVEDRNSSIQNWGSYWSSTNETRFNWGYYSYSLGISDRTCSTHQAYRCYGLAIRPVAAPTIFNELTLSSRYINLHVGKSLPVEIIYGSGNYEISNSNPDVISVSLSGTTITITGVDKGSATISLTDTKNGQTAVIEVTVDAYSPDISCPDFNHPHMIDLGLPSGTKWACCNVGADKPDSLGGYYAWGETEEKDHYDLDNYVHCDVGIDVDTEALTYTYRDIGSDIAGTQYDVAHVKWGGSWVMPSLEQIKELEKKCTSEWYTLNGAIGIRYKGPNGNSIFLSVTPVEWGSLTYSDLDGGIYWSSTLESFGVGVLTYYINEYSWITDTDRYCGGMVRPVSQ